MKQLNKKEVKKLFKKSKRTKEVVVILENIQYARNVAAMFRTLDAAGVSKVFLTGITKTPPFGKDLSKTSRKKERSVPWVYEQDTSHLIGKLRRQDYIIIAVELTDNAQDIADLEKIIKDHNKVCFLFGSEVYGVTKKTLEIVDTSIFIPMFGVGASLNVSTTLGIVLFSF